MRYPAALVLTLSLFATAGCAAPAAGLFNGRDLAGWEFITVPAVDIKEVCTFKPDGVIAVTGKPVGFLATTSSHTNYRLHAEWRWPDKPGSNGGVLVHISSGPKDRAWPLSLQIQTKNKNAGDVLPMAGATFAEPLTSPAGATANKAHMAPDSEKPVGEWNTCDITCRDGTIEVVINGVRQNTVTHANPAAGRVGFQLEGAPFELRAVRLTPLD